MTAWTRIQQLRDEIVRTWSAEKHASARAAIELERRHGLARYAASEESETLCHQTVTSFKEEES